MRDFFLRKEKNYEDIFTYGDLRRARTACQRSDEDETTAGNFCSHFLFLFFPKHNAQSVCSREDAHSTREANKSGHERESEYPPRER